MASPADAIAYAAHGGWDQATVMQVAYWLQTGQEPDGLTSQARQAINDIGGMGLSAMGVSQLTSYLQTGRAPADLSYTDESAQVLGGGTPPSASAAPASAPAPAPTQLTSEQQSARAMIQSGLDEYGLGQLGSRLWQQYMEGAPIEQIWMNLRETSEYKTRFAGMKPLQDRGRAISERDYIDIERSYAQAARAAGLPSGFYDSPDDFSRLIGGEVSPAEFAQRVQTYAQMALAAPTEVRNELERLYGIGPGELTAFFIDPDRALPMLQSAARAAEVSAAASRAGFGGLQRSEAERLAQLDVSTKEAQEGFGQLVDARELFTPLDAGEEVIGRETQIGAAFAGDSIAKREIDKRIRRRQAQFEGGGGYARSETGFSGVGSA